jgi:hypothetical protein
MPEGQLSLTPEHPDQGRTPLHGAKAIASAGLQFAEVHGAAVDEFVVLEMAADVFGRIELGRVGRQLVDLDGAVECFQVPAHESRSMGGEPVPDGQQRLPNLLPEDLQELDNLRILDRPGGRAGSRSART